MKKYGSLKKFIDTALHDFNSRLFVIVNDILAFFTLISIVGIVLKTVPSLASYDSWFFYIEVISVTVFSFEYLVRIYVAENKIKYIFSFFGIIDLLSILPTYLAVANLTFLKSVRVLRILRFLRMMRLAKLIRLERKKSKDMEEYRHLYYLNIQIYFFVLFSAILVFGSLIYVFEFNGGIFLSIPHGMLWAAKVVLGGIPSQVPTTIIGNILTVLARFVGLVLFGLLINVIGISVKRMLFGTELDENSKKLLKKY